LYYIIHISVELNWSRAHVEEEEEEKEEEGWTRYPGALG
jgi:hypothetical protein